jgi:hypothetical protein
VKKGGGRYDRRRSVCPKTVLSLNCTIFLKNVCEVLQKAVIMFTF